MIRVVSDGQPADVSPDPRNPSYRDLMEWVAAGNVIAPYVEPPTPVPEEISDRQFFEQLAIDQLITQDEALAAVMTGTLPAAFVTFIAALPGDQQFGARMALCGATIFQRSHPLVAAFGAMQGMSSDQLDVLWRDAFAL